MFSCLRGHGLAPPRHLSWVRYPRIAAVRDPDEESLRGWTINPTMTRLQQTLSTLLLAHANFLPELQSKTTSSGNESLLGEGPREHPPHFKKQISLYV